MDNMINNHAVLKHNLMMDCIHNKNYIYCSIFGAMTRSASAYNVLFSDNLVTEVCVY